MEPNAPDKWQPNQAMEFAGLELHSMRVLEVIEMSYRFHFGALFNFYI